MGISIRFEDAATEEAHGTNATRQRSDFPSSKELKRAVKRVFKEYPCPECGGRKVDGDGVVVKMGKVKLFRQELKKGFLGSKHVDKHVGDVWRVHKIYLAPSGFISLVMPAGYLRCKSCKWEQRGGKSVTWLSINDLRGGRF